MAGIGPSPGGSGGSGGAGCKPGSLQYKADIRVSIGNYVVETPNVISVNVSRTRGNPVSSASVQFIYSGNAGSFGNGAGRDLQITVYGSTPYFKGIVKKVSIAPSFRVAKEFIIRIQAEDVMHKLTNKRYTRRQKTSGIGPVAIITNLYKRPDLGADDPSMRHNIERQGSTVEAIVHTFNIADMTHFLKSGQDNTLGDLHTITKIADRLIKSTPASTGGGIGLHDHTSMSTTGIHSGGPSLSVFGVK
jgi:hypothetical protein